jgi:hypothetical protein
VSDSDSGEDFDYGDEDGEQNDYDLADYISQMPLDHLKEDNT